METVKKSQLVKDAKGIFRQLSIPFSVLLLMSCFLLWTCLDGYSKENDSENTNKDIYAMNYDVSQLDDSADNTIIKQGYEVFQNTSKYIGPARLGISNSYAGNNLSCTNCHLGAGTKPYAAPLIGIMQRFPQFRSRENKIGTIEERINGCMERSMNGVMMPSDSKEMKAMVAYMNWLSRYAPKDGKIKGQGFVKIEIPNRAVDLKKGEGIFNAICIVCHGKNGQGKKSLSGSNYDYPPLWGNDSYNDGAGMTRVLTAARFIKANMPFGATYNNPVLTDEEAYDVAGYINQQLRPKKENQTKDFPDIKKKPVSTPYPPYADTFSLQQHQMGPFQPIMEYYKSEYNIVKSK